MDLLERLQALIDGRHMVYIKTANRDAVLDKIKSGNLEMEVKERPELIVFTGDNLKSLHDILGEMAKIGKSEPTAKMYVLCIDEFDGLSIDWICDLREKLFTRPARLIIISEKDVPIEIANFMYVMKVVE